jgi:hypothetical protein
MQALNIELAHGDSEKQLIMSPMPSVSKKVYGSLLPENKSDKLF